MTRVRKAQKHYPRVFFQTILTGVVNTALSLDIQLQFEIYAVLMLCPAVGFAAYAAVKMALHSRRKLH
jgi:hypothetical protein